MSALSADIAAPAQASVGEARVPPYTALAPVYDRMMGQVAAPVIWQAFRESCARFGIRSARRPMSGAAPAVFCDDLLHRDAVFTA